MDKYNKYVRYEQENKVVELLCNIDTMDPDEWEEEYEKLSPKYKKQVDEGCIEYADNAVGSSSWRSDW